jgi:aspartate/methionine/tyrosine aminotransferase
VTMEAQASELNQIIEKNSRAAYSLLSKKGREIFFPKKGILAQTAEAKGKRINATIGEAVENDRSPMRLDAIARHITLPPEMVFPYAPSPGKPELRNKWREMLSEKNPPLKGKSYSLPLVSAGLTHGLSILGFMFVDQGDTVLLPDHYWENYNLLFSNWHGGEMKTFPLFKGNVMDLDALKRSLNAGGRGKKILLMTFPNNPTGYTPTETEMQEIVAILKDSAEQGNHILVMIDDSYFGLVYKPGVEKNSMFAFIADLHENILAVKVDGATKEDYVWGFRVGFLTFGTKNGSAELYSALEFKTAGAIRGNISNVSHLSQSLVLKALESGDYQKEKAAKFALLKSRCDKVIEVLAAHPEYNEVFEALPFNSGYFMCVRLSSGIDGEKVRKVLLDEFNTGIIAFGDIIRIAFSSVDASLIGDLFENLFKAGKKVKGA